MATLHNQIYPKPAVGRLRLILRYSTLKDAFLPDSVTSSDGLTEPYWDLQGD